MAIMNNFPVGGEDKERIYCYYSGTYPHISVSPDDKDNYDIYAVYSSGKNYQSSGRPMGVCCSTNATGKSYTIKVLHKLDVTGYYLCFGGHGTKGSKPGKYLSPYYIDLSNVVIGATYKVINKGSCKFEIYDSAGTLLASQTFEYGPSFLPYIVYITN